MITGVILKKLQKFTDERGWLTEAYRQDQDHYQPAMSYLSYTKNGVVRGPHEHVSQSDLFIFAGPGDFELHLWDRRAGSDTKGEYRKIVVGESNPCTVIVPPGVVHGYKCLSSAGSWSINLPDKLYKGVDKAEEIDEIRWEIDPASPYKIV
ncbi:dTDP-4-dehydrorhamnose 3,5-epimerase [Candidatus Falkowbacteria bacterium CG10_big_fil_rev_8_21_14_0_10_39_9]|uniref:dTDP-4-dehydrorhamnose 3,5-epimerase n=1 Tax=Candidatus Falkowbacteria bacterium CG10_big_fil_rev_8_21_14_0_10_39_9 TaxID=1974566 RepID=A0A2M6WN97_9BACT|nr:MAG: dTDP-4-dehydrorhamnose 3,5-epimerase [Candidatus Falkowbacteria bacterium CG10_big_fil_rev_8_21_14_0_10_39_9]